MPHRAPRPLLVLLSVPVSVLAAAALALSAHAQATPAPRPTPVVIAIDPGHGGSPDNADPGQPFDPGTIAADGTQEKDLTLDVGRRVQTLLQGDLVKVVMTRTDDRYVSIQARMQTAIDAGAAAFVSIHFNAFGDVSTGGALVLYPNDGSRPFAQLMDEHVHARLQPFSEASGGAVLKDDLWVHATMPAVTVEGGYLSNADDAARLQRNDYRDALATGVLDGIEAQVPTILQRKPLLAAWDASHHTAAAQPGTAASSSNTGAAGAAASGSALPSPLVWGAVLLLALWFRRRLWVSLRWLAEHMVPGAVGRRAVLARRREGLRSRRHAALERSRGRGAVAPRRRRVHRTAFHDGTALHDDPRL